MLTIVHVIDPMFATVVAGERLKILERLPRVLHEPPSRVVLDLVEQTVRQHDLPDIVMIFRTMNQKASPLDYLYERLAESQWLTSVVVGYLVPPVIDKSSGAVLDIIGTTGAMCWLLPRAIDRRRRIFASRHVLRRRIAVIVDFDPLLPDLDFLPR